jgi:DNA polymerase I-like protein with 3'-5' exonuclease and polymerase domains
MTTEADKYTPIAFDVEVTMRSTVGKNKASAFCPYNELVSCATESESMYRPNTYYAKQVLNQHYKLVGQNFKFDLHWIRRKAGDEKYLKWVENGGRVYDTQLAEYLLTGQATKYARLDGLAKKYLGEEKQQDKVKEYWDNGFDTDQIPKDILLKYNHSDSDLTMRIAQKQGKLIREQGLEPLLRSQNLALLALQEMEWNGLHVDLKRLQELTEATRRKYDAAELALEKIVWHTFNLDQLPQESQDRIRKDLKIGSDKLWSAIFFGSEYNVKLPTPTGEVYKSGQKKGQAKTKLEPHDIGKVRTWQPLSALAQGAALNQKGYYSVDEQVLKNCMSKSSTEYYSKIADLLLQYRGIAKELGTYYEGLAKLIHTDGKIHHNLNQCATSTGRLSSTEPNGQNLPSTAESQVKDIFSSRWGEDGIIVEADYSQLEVIALAHLSGDPQLTQDILSGADLHYETGKGVMGWTDPSEMTVDDRRKVKTVNFALIYGATARGIAKTSGMTVEFVQKLIDSFYNRYPHVKVWQDQNHARVTKSAKRGDVVGTTEKGYPKHRGYLVNETGRKLAFDEVDGFKQGQLNISPTKVKNYPVQSLATGDIVPLVLGKLFTSLIEHDIITHVKMINTVHDSIIFDIHKEKATDALRLIHDVMSSAPRLYNNTFNTNFTLPLKVEIEYGKTWKQAKQKYNYGDIIQYD